MINCDVYNSTKCGKWIKFNSDFELRRMRELDKDETVIDWDRNHIKFEFNDQICEPAITVKTNDGLFIIEDIIIGVPNPERIKFAIQFYENLGYKYKVISFGLHEELSIEPILERYLNKFGEWERISLLFAFMKMTISISQRSTCVRRRVGCIVVKDNLENVYSIGYNGSPSGKENGCKKLDSGSCGCIHAEINSLKKINFEIEDSILLCTLSPCKNCSKEILKYPIKRVIYLEAYRDLEGVNYLKKKGIMVNSWEELTKN
jgi:dCMP deaminase